MIEYNDEWIIKTDNINLTDDAKTQEMTLYAFCMKGNSNLTYDGKAFELKPGMLLVANNCSVMSVGRQTDDFAVEGMFVHPKYHNLTALRSNYTLRHILLLNANPVMELLPKEQERWHRDYENVFYQLCEGKQIPARNDDSGQLAAHHRLLRLHKSHLRKGRHIDTGIDTGQQILRDA